MTELITWLISPPKEKLLLWKSGWKTVSALLIKNRGNTESLMSQDDEVRLWIVPQEMVLFYLFSSSKFCISFVATGSCSTFMYRVRNANSNSTAVKWLEMLSATEWNSYLECVTSYIHFCFVVHLLRVPG